MNMSWGARGTGVQGEDQTKNPFWFMYKDLNLPQFGGNWGQRCPPAGGGGGGRVGEWVNQKNYFC